MLGAEELRAWYGALDVLLSVGNEGFGLPVMEAQACGTPVVAGNYSSGPELCASGRLVRGQDDWDEPHEKRWHIPFIYDVAARLQLGYEHPVEARTVVREFALARDADQQW